MPEVSARTAARAAIGEGAGFNAIRRDYEVIPDGLRERAAQPSPREIVARLHEQIAAQGPEQAALVAAFERRQAARERQP